MTLRNMLTNSDDGSRSLVGKAVDQIASPVPKWAKWARNIGLIVGAIGGSIATSGVALPAIVMSAAPYMVLFGNATALIAQGFKK
jgi:hypothetical protein